MKISLMLINYPQISLIGYNPNLVHLRCRVAYWLISEPHGTRAWSRQHSQMASQSFLWRLFCFLLSHVLNFG